MYESSLPNIYPWLLIGISGFGFTVITTARLQQEWKQFVSIFIPTILYPFSPKATVLSRDEEYECGLEIRLRAQNNYCIES